MIELVDGEERGRNWVRVVCGWVDGFGRDGGLVCACCLSRALIIPPSVPAAAAFAWVDVAYDG